MVGPFRTPTVRGGFVSIVIRGVPLLGPLPVSVSVVTVASVRPPAQGHMNPDVESAVTWRQHEGDTVLQSVLQPNLIQRLLRAF